MARKLDFTPLDIEEATDIKARAKETANRRWVSRDPNPVVQMSIRMHAETYEQFQELRKRERRTNGEMLEVLMESYFTKARGADKPGT